MEEKNNLFKEHDMVTRVAWKYHKENLTQKEIADNLGISRFKVMKMLDKAEKNGIIEVKINTPYFNCLSYEEKLKSKFDLDDAFVAPNPQNNKEIRKMIGKAGGQYLNELINPGDEIGTAWGRTLNETAEHYKCGLEDGCLNTDFVWLRGGLNIQTTLGINDFDVARRLANKTGGMCYYIFAPARAESFEAKKMFLSDEKVKAGLDKARSVNKALIGIGGVTEQASSLVKTGLITKKEMKRLNERGAEGEILGRFYDINGNPIDSEINDQMIGLTLNELKSIDKIIAFAGGENKAKPIYGALKGGYLNVLITIENTAEKLIEI